MPESNTAAPLFQNDNPFHLGPGWSGRRESNSLRLDWKSSILPLGSRPRTPGKEIGKGGFIFKVITLSIGPGLDPKIRSPRPESNWNLVCTKDGL